MGVAVWTGYAILTGYPLLERRARGVTKPNGKRRPMSPVAQRAALAALMGAGRGRANSGTPGIGSEEVAS